MNAAVVVLWSSAAAFGVLANLTGSMAAAAWAAVLSVVAGVASAHGALRASSPSKGVEA